MHARALGGPELGQVPGLELRGPPGPAEGGSGGLGIGTRFWGGGGGGRMDVVLGREATRGDFGMGRGDFIFGVTTYGFKAPDNPMPTI